MIDSVQKINNYLENPSEITVQNLNKVCCQLIYDPSVKDKKKFEAVTRAYESACKYPGETHELNRNFFDLYRELEKKVVKKKYATKCIEKSEEISEKINRPDTLVPRLAKMTISDDDHLSKKGSGDLRRRFPKKGVPQLETNRIPENNPDLEMEFFCFLDSLNAQIDDCRVIINENSEEIIFVQKWIKLILNIFELLEKREPRIQGEPKKRNESEQLLEAYQKAINPMEKIISNIDKLGKFQENKAFIRKLKELLGLIKGSLFVKKEARLPPIDSQYDNEIVKNLERCQEVNDELFPLLVKKDIKNRKEMENLSSKIKLHSDFIQFTEKNYASLLLSEEKRKIIHKTIISSECFFQHLMRLTEIPELAFISYISLLVQKHIFIDAEEGKQENIREIEELCFKYSVKYSKNIENHQALYEILRIDDMSKISPKLLSPKKSPKNCDKEKADKMMLKVIKKAMQFLDIKSILNEKANKCIKLRKISLARLLNRTSNTFSKLCTFDLKNHQLEEIDLLKIAYVTERIFFFKSSEGYKNADYTIGRQNLFFIKPSHLSRDLLSRPLLIDIEKEKFVVLSKLYGDIKLPIIDLSDSFKGHPSTVRRRISQNLTSIPEESENESPPPLRYVYVTGAVKKVSAAVLFSWLQDQQDALVFEESILAVPIKNKILDQNLVKYLFEFKGKRGLMSCDFYMEYVKEGTSGAKFKQKLIQKRAVGGDLLQFFEKYSLRYMDTWKMLFSILEDVAYGLEYMHSRGYIHWDIKLANILFQDEKGMLNDFDTTFDVRAGEQPSWLSLVYGVDSYRAPEVTLEGITFQKVTEKGAKRRDMFGLGCTLIDILCTGQTIAKGERVYERIRDKHIISSEIDAYIQSTKSAPLHDYEKFLICAAYNLIYPDPVKRWTIERFKKELIDFKKEKINL